MPAFLHGSGAPGELIGAFGWSTTPPVALSTWSPTLKATTSLILQSAVPIITLWSESGVMIYNDGYAEFAAARHPIIPGSNVRESRVREEQARLRQMFKQGPGFMVMMTGKDHVFDPVNPAYLQLIGHRDVLHKPVCKALVKPYDGDSMKLPFKPRFRSSAVNRDRTSRLHTGYFHRGYIALSISSTHTP